MMKTSLLLLLIPDDVTFPLLPFRAEAAHTLPVQEGSLLCQCPHHAVSGCDLGQWVRTVDFYGSGTGAIHTETCQGDRQEAPKTHNQDFTPHLYSVVCLFFFFLGYFAIFFCNKYFVFLRSTKIVKLCLKWLSWAYV